MIRWFTKNDLAANFLLLGIVVAGVIAAYTSVPLEVRPTREFPMVRVNIPYRGGAPEEVEKLITIPVEQSLQGMSGIKQVDSVSRQGSAQLTIHMDKGVNPRDLLPEIERRVNGVSLLPDGTESANFSIPDTAKWFEVLNVVVQADLPLTELTPLAYQVRSDLLNLSDVTRATVVGTSPREFTIRLDPELLHYYQLTYQQLASAIRQNTREVGAGNINYETGRIAIRPGKTALQAADFAKVPIQLGNGTTVRLEEVAEINDGFREELKRVRYNGKPALMIEIFQTREQSAIALAESVRTFLVENPQRYGQQVSLHIWDDESYRIEGRLSTLRDSLLLGGLLVFITLGLFLRPSIAFWVVLGIPVSFAGGILFMPLFGMTANMMSIFAFILVLGIVVDDAIVTGESVYARLLKGQEGLEAAVLGTKDVTLPVVFGVLTTIVAFLPLLYFDGYWGVLAEQIPPIIAPVLLFSLIESKLILPAHLKHIRISRGTRRWYNLVPDACNAALVSFSERVVRPTITLCTRHRYATFAFFLALGLTAIGYWQSGRLGFQVFPATDLNKITATLLLRDEAQIRETEVKVEKVYQAATALSEFFLDGEGEAQRSLITGIITCSGGRPSGGYQANYGYLSFEILPPELRQNNFASNKEIVAKFRELCAPHVADLRSFRVRSQNTGRHIGNNEPEPIEIEVRGRLTEDNLSVMDQVYGLVRKHTGELETIYDNKPTPQAQLRISLNQVGHSLGLTEDSLARQIRTSFIGEELARLTRETGEIKVILKLDDTLQEDRYILDRLLITLQNGEVVPLSSVATVKSSLAPKRITRIDGAPVTNITAAPKDKNEDLLRFAQAIRPSLNELFNQFPELNWQFRGYLENYAEMQQRFLLGTLVLCLCLYVLLALPFNSLVQPFFVIIAIPFGVIGALIGHAVMDITPSYLSLFGLLALSGIVINDSLVLVDTINKLVKEGVPVNKAVVQASTRRFRPIFLTSITTFVGLVPLMFEKSIQAQFLIPMAVSLAYGILFATFVTLVLIPVVYLLCHDLKHLVARFWGWYKSPFAKK